MAADEGLGRDGRPVIVVNAAHGPCHPGAAGGGYVEEAVTFALAEGIALDLTGLRADVVRTRPSADACPTHAARNLIAAAGDVSITLHAHDSAIDACVLSSERDRQAAAFAEAVERSIRASGAGVQRRWTHSASICRGPKPAIVVVCGLGRLEAMRAVRAGVVSAVMDAYRL